MAPFNLIRRSLSGLRKPQPALQHDPEAGRQGQAPGSGTSTPEHARPSQESRAAGLEKKRLAYRRFQENFRAELKKLQESSQISEDQSTQLEQRYLPERPPVLETPNPFDEVKGTITYFKLLGERDQPLVHGRQYPVREMTVSDTAFQSIEVSWKDSRQADRHTETEGNASELPDIRWVHLPANNMDWIEQVLLHILESYHKPVDSGEDWSEQVRSQILHPDSWQFRQNQIPQSPIHGRSMKPYAAVVVNPKKPPAVLPEKDARELSTLAAYVPYLHWERSVAAAYMKHVVGDVDNYGLAWGFNPDSATETISQLNINGCCPDEFLLRRYLRYKPPLHIRRTLDQSFHTYLPDTQSRDYDQVIARYAKKRFVQKYPEFDLEPPIVMVDQCWLWIINETTILTCFPTAWRANDGLPDPLDVQKKIMTLLSKPHKQANLNSAFSLAHFILEQCTANMLQTSIVIKERHRFLEWFSHSIGLLMERQTSCLKTLWLNVDKENRDMNDALFNTTEEFQMLEEAKDIAEELQMIEKVVDCQIDTFKQLRTSCSTSNGLSAKSSYLKPCRLLLHARARKEAIRELSTRAKGVTDEILQLLQLKQQQAGISEARTSRRLAEESISQSRSIILFTTVTILFLPLSTLASIFGINAAEFGQGEVNVGVIFAYILPISALCIGISLYFVFNHTARRWVEIAAITVSLYLLSLLPCKSFSSRREKQQKALARLRDERDNKDQRESSAEDIYIEQFHDEHEHDEAGFDGRESVQLSTASQEFPSRSSSSDNDVFTSGIDTDSEPNISIGSSGSRALRRRRVRSSRSMSNSDDFWVSWEMTRPHSRPRLNVNLGPETSDG